MYRNVTREWTAAVVGALLVWSTLAALRAGSYAPWPDGDWKTYGAAGLLWSIAAPITWLVVRLSAGYRSSLPWIAALGVLLPFDVTHYARLTQRDWQPVVTLERGSNSAAASSARPTEWDFVVQTGATATAADGQVTIVNPIGVAGYAELRLPALPSGAWQEVWLPRGLLQRRYFERVEWEGVIERWAPFQVLLHTDRIAVQATSYGFAVTYPGDNRVATTFDINSPAANDGAVHHFLLERADGVIRLRLDGFGAWVRPDTGQLKFIRFGEGSAEPLHGGRQELRAVRYVRRYNYDDE